MSLKVTKDDEILLAIKRDPSILNEENRKKLNREQRRYLDRFLKKHKNIVDTIA